ncbi:AAA family ATPase [Burkholderia sp. BCC1988]|uniref:AAA family ATPase n=1 Tax=Burkholderia sp. BCC1988 TaxID=2817443 RepID=UPI002AB16DD3|nr:AAA family ATPase [Burkholderia sp. BCC1988]
MYFKDIEIENTGPIDHVKIEFYDGVENPKPMIIVGENGSGKSILLSNIVNCMLAAKQEVFDDSEVEKGKVYKYRSPSYIKSGKYYSFCHINFTGQINLTEWQLLNTRKYFEENFSFSPARKDWANIPINETSRFWANFNQHLDETNKFVKNQCALYFPVNRFEDPGWLNIDNLTSRARYTELKRVSGYSNRAIICTSPLKENRDWLLDLLFDRQAFEIQISPLSSQLAYGRQPQLVQVFSGYRGQSNAIYDAILRLLKVVLRETGNIRLGIGTRKNRQISIMKDEAAWIPNLFQLSTGEAQLLNLFLSILRDYDLSGGEFSDLADVKGVVVIDEIDAHLHTEHQISVLPELIASFPKVQFIITTHSPLFLMGMEAKLGENGFNIVDMPRGNRIVASDFSEFVEAHKAFKETEKYREDVSSELVRLSRPIVYVEGDYDIRYLERAAALLNKQEILDRVELADADGYGNLDKIWRSWNNQISSAIPGKIILIYDCDTNKQNSNNNRVFRRVVPTIRENPIQVGVENLFPRETIEKLEAANPRFIDVCPESTSRIRGEEVVTPQSKSVNRDEKRNVCDWLCEHGELEDFVNFGTVFSIIEEIVEA